MEGKTIFVKDDGELLRTLNARKNIRAQLDEDIEAFLSKGGCVEEIDVNVMTDPPTRPISKYGGKPI